MNLASISRSGELPHWDEYQAVIPALRVDAGTLVQTGGLLSHFRVCGIPAPGEIEQEHVPALSGGGSGNELPLPGCIDYEPGEVLAWAGTHQIGARHISRRIHVRTDAQLDPSADCLLGAGSDLRGHLLNYIALTGPGR